jgi:hypothetical protein
MKGAISAQFTIVGQSTDGLVIESTGSIATTHGSISVESSGFPQLSGLVVTFQAAGTVTGGTDKYAHATGELAFNGAADLAAGTFTEGITGAMCR